MAKPKMTEWFKGNQQPARVGVYQCRGGPVGVAETYQYWNGTWWGQWAGSPERAERDLWSKSMRQQPEWRGLAEQPKEQKK